MATQRMPKRLDIRFLKLMKIGKMNLQMMVPYSNKHLAERTIPVEPAIGMGETV